MAERERIISALEKNNPWWKGEFSADYKPRKVFDEINKFMSKKQIISLTGLRRTGKTTLLMKIIEDYLSKYGGKNIVYFSFDDFRDVRIEEIIDAYNFLLEKEEPTKVLVVLDEIQKVNDWDEQLKRMYDEHKSFKFLISGSESLFIRKGARESLAGRMFEFQIKTLDFGEFLNFRGKNFINLRLYKKEILSEFRRFTFCNGFPEAVGESEEFIIKYIKENVVEKIIYRDIPQIIQIGNPEILFQIFSIIAKKPGQLINIDSLAGTVNITRQTVSNYLDYLEKSFLIRKLYNYSNNPRKTQTRLKKYYPTIIMPEDTGNRELFGMVFEAVIVNSLNAEYFWRDVYKNEVDVVLRNKDILPIEIKVSDININSLKLFMRKFKLKKGVLLTYDKESKEIDGIKIIPFYEFLLRGR